MTISDAALLATGMGVLSTIGQGKTEFAQGLWQGSHQFAELKRPGRQAPNCEVAPFLGAEITEFTTPPKANSKLLRTASLSAQLALSVVDEAWQESRLDEVDPRRIGLVIGGSNVQQRELVLVQEKYAGRSQFIRPS